MKTQNSELRMQNAELEKQNKVCRVLSSDFLVLSLLEPVTLQPAV
jgi:hypothetical protein